MYSTNNQRRVWGRLGPRRWQESEVREQIPARGCGEVPGRGHLGVGRRTGQRRNKDVIANGLRTAFERLLNAF